MPTTNASGDTTACAPYPKPSWQTGAGVPSDGVRDLPDISLFAGTGTWNHYYVFCDTDPADTGSLSSDSCSGAPETWAGAGGTSFAAPILAGVQALINQAVGSTQGNPSPTYYRLAASQIASGLACNSTLGSATAGGCVFYDVTQGDMDVDCADAYSCYDPSGVIGVLSTNTAAFAPAYGTTSGWDFATGLGSINAQNLVTYWTSADLSLSATGAMSAGVLAYTIKVGNSGPAAASSVTVTVSLPVGASLAAGSSSRCSETGQLVSCTLGSVSSGATASVSIDVAGASGSSVTLVFNVAAKNPDLDPENDGASVTLATASVPLPAWAPPALAALLLMVAARGSRRAARRPTRS